MSLIEPREITEKPVPVCHRAGWVMVSPDQVLENGYVTLCGGKILNVGQGREGAVKIMDHGPGVLMPALVNAHTHLELSALKDKARMDGDFISWVRSVIAEKAELGEPEMIKAMLSAISQVKRTGTATVGDIANMEFSRNIFCNSPLSGVQFREYLGPDTNTPLLCNTLATNKHISVAGHAPHSTAPELLRRLKQAARDANLPFSLHLAESTAEMEFMATGKGPWQDFLAERGLDSAMIPSRGAGPVTHARALGLLDRQTLAVHMVFADKKDIRMIAESQSSVCLCPRSNMLLHRRLPDIETMVAEGLNLCLGTDSLASNTSLSLFDEMTYLALTVPGISPNRILAMATKNGSEALGFGHCLGSLAPGFLSKMIYAPISANRPENVFAALVSGEFAKPMECIY